MVKKGKQPQEWNGWRVLALLIKRLFDLLENGMIYPALVIVLVGFMAFVAFLAPEESIGLAVNRFTEWLFSSTGAWAVLFTVSNIAWVYLYRRMKKNYKDELDRVGRVRSELLHNPARMPIKNHRSTEEPGNEVYLEPGKSTKPTR